MERTLSVDAAKLLIDFIYSTNYQLAPEGDGLFESKDEAISFVESENYNPEEPLHICFDTKQGNYMDSVVASFDGTVWEVEDYQMGGAYASGESIEEALKTLRSKFDPEEDFCPVELIVNK